MLTSDLLRTGIYALWRQKLRTILTLIGVAIGCGTLVVSLACGIGVKQAVDAQFKKQTRLRQISVFPAPDQTDDKLTGVPEEILNIPGTMSEAKRQRIQKQEIQRWKRDNRQNTPKPLTEALMRELRALPHVESVEPDLTEYGRVYLDGNTATGNIAGIVPDAPLLAKRIEVGTSFSAADAPEALMNEYLLYRLGVRDDAAVENCIGKTIRIELSNAGRSELNLLRLFDVDASQLTEDEMRVLQKAWGQMPALMANVNLSDEEKKKLLKVLQRKQPGTKASEEKIIRGQFKIVGVTRGSEKSDPGTDDLLDGELSDVMLPQDTANTFFMKLPRRIEMGYNRARIIVDKEENLQEVVQHIKDMGLKEFSLGLFVQQLRRNVTLIGFAMDFIALVALVVAAVGITNTTFTNVLERTKEIGIMKAVGARDRQVLSMFLIEGSMIGLMGGIAGVLLGWLAKFPGDRMGLSEMAKQTDEALPETLFIYPLALVIAVPLFAMVVTTLAALLPARRAARIEPVEALRHE